MATETKPTVDRLFRYKDQSNMETKWWVGHANDLVVNKLRFLETIQNSSSTRKQDFWFVRGSEVRSSRVVIKNMAGRMYTYEFIDHTNNSIIDQRRRVASHEIITFPFFPDPNIQFKIRRVGGIGEIVFSTIDLDELNANILRPLNCKEVGEERYYFTPYTKALNWFESGSTGQIDAADSFI